MIDVLLTVTFYPKNFHNERKRYRLCFVIPKAGCFGMFVITEQGKLALKALICTDTSLRQSPNRSSHFQVDKSLVRQCRHVVLFLCPTGEQSERHAHVFKVIKVRHQVKVFYVKTHIFCALCANDAIPM